MFYIVKSRIQRCLSRKYPVSMGVIKCEPEFPAVSSKFLEYGLNVAVSRQHLFVRFQWSRGILKWLRFVQGSVNVVVPLDLVDEASAVRSERQWPQSIEPCSVGVERIQV